MKIFCVLIGSFQLHIYSFFMLFNLMLAYLLHHYLKPVPNHFFIETKDKLVLKSFLWNFLLLGFLYKIIINCLKLIHLLNKVRTYRIYSLFLASHFLFHHLGKFQLLVLNVFTFLARLEGVEQTKYLQDWVQAIF